MLTLTDKTPEMTEQTKIHISSYLFAMMSHANKDKMEDIRNASD